MSSIVTGERVAKFGEWLTNRVRYEIVESREGNIEAVKNWLNEGSILLYFLFVRFTRRAQNWNHPI